MTCLLPKSYPSDQPPIFTLSVKWLEPVKILNLCYKLDSIWEEQQGQEVIYPWVEWLHSSSLSHLGFDEEIILGPYGMNYVQDERVISGAECIDVDIPFLRSYNDERHNENFLKELHDCNICFSEYAGKFLFVPDNLYTLLLFKGKPDLVLHKVATNFKFQLIPLPSQFTTELPSLVETWDCMSVHHCL